VSVRLKCRVSIAYPWTEKKKKENNRNKEQANAINCINNDDGGGD
jgi:hypothetical protein